MNENLQPQTRAISDWLRRATRELKAAGIASARLDAELILAHTIRKSRTYLHAHGDEPLAPHRQAIADARLQLRLDFTPVAYIIGHKEFYGRLFKVTTATLIPRPESEDIVDIVKEIVATQPRLFGSMPHRIVDVGTGTGCIGISIKCELGDEVDVTLIDVSRHALTVAEANAHALRAEVRTLRGDLLRSYALPADIIVANLPYVDRAWEVSRETHAEPDLALYADKDGLSLIYTLIEQATSRLVPGGSLILEADPRQHDAMTEYAKRHGFTLREVRGFIAWYRLAT